MLGEHGPDQLRRPSSTRSFGTMELAIIVAVQPHIPVTHEEATSDLDLNSEAEFSSI